MLSGNGEEPWAEIVEPGWKLSAAQGRRGRGGTGGSRVKSLPLAPVSRLIAVSALVFSA